MKKLNIDNWFFRTMALIGDWVMLSVLWVIGCLPVVTAGAATLSVFAVAHKMAAGQDYAVCRDFCKAFRRDFRQATVLWLPARPAGAGRLVRRAHPRAVGRAFARRSRCGDTRLGAEL